MYFWKIDNLKKDLIKKPLSEKEQFKYLIATIILFNLALATNLLMENSIWNIYSVIISGIVDIFGMFFLYRINGGSNGKYFLQRLLSLGWVIGIRWTVLILLPINIIVFNLGVPEDTAVFSLVIDNLTYLVYLWMLGKNIKEVAAKFENSK